MLESAYTVQIEKDTDVHRGVVEVVNESTRYMEVHFDIPITAMCSSIVGSMELVFGRRAVWQAIRNIHAAGQAWIAKRYKNFINSIDLILFLTVYYLNSGHS